MVLPASETACLPPGRTSRRTVTYKDPFFKLHSFVILAGELEVTVNVIKMKDSVYIWLGSHKEPNFNDLSMAVRLEHFNEITPTKLIGSFLDTTSLNMAARLSRRLSKQVLVSCNVALDRFNTPAVEKGIMLEIKNNLEKF